MLIYCYFSIEGIKKQKNQTANSGEMLRSSPVWEIRGRRYVWGHCSCHGGDRDRVNEGMVDFIGYLGRPGMCGWRRESL